ncbi:MAG: hypothetical protein LBI10_01265 [Deltaproteobacteria bacterium]|jgi:cell pole-organizing protein PopZ|nr:hypothetical protein [Deltaproteobacteria bacterium]
MKIDEKQVFNVFLRPQEAQKQAANNALKTNSPDFAALLGESSQSRTTTLEELGVNLLPKFDAVGQLQVNQAQATNSNPYSYAADDIDSLLSLLDNYATALSDPKNTLKDLAPLADDLSLKAQELGQTSQKLTADDPLKSLANDASTVAMVEALKFKRGDYI